MKKRFFNGIAALLLLVSSWGLASCGGNGTQATPSPTETPTPTSQQPVQTVRDVTVVEANTLVQENAENPDFVIIDVRTPEEFSQGHLENAILIDYRADGFETEISKLDRDKKYLIYCRTANRSASARDIMEELGFLDINHMAGGITEWAAQGFPVVE